MKKEQEHSTESSEPVAEIKTNRRRATGEKISDYKNYKNWSNDRWAWEFLRRNPAYRKACLALEELEGDALDEKEQEVARNFHLKRFVHWKISFSKGAPRFLMHSTWQKIREGQESRKLRISIRPDQVAVRFNLAPALLTKRSIEAQIKAVEHTLRKRLSELAELTKMTPRATKTPDAEMLIRWLRLLDAKRNRIPNAQIYEWLSPQLEGTKKQRTEGDGSKPQDEVDDMLRSANSMRDFGYLSIAFAPKPIRETIKQ